jgi:hypothetical protein
VNIARQHHFLPECYLRGFTRGAGHLFALDLKKRESYFASPKKVCKERDFNTVDAPGLKPDALETQLAKFEGKLAPALSKRPGKAPFSALGVMPGCALIKRDRCTRAHYGTSGEYRPATSPHT